MKNAVDLAIHLDGMLWFTEVFTKIDDNCAKFQSFLALKRFAFQEMVE